MVSALVMRTKICFRLSNLLYCARLGFANLGRVKAAIIDDRKLIRIALIRINLRSLRSIDSSSLSRWPKSTKPKRVQYRYEGEPIDDAKYYSTNYL